MSGVLQRRGKNFGRFPSRLDLASGRVEMNHGGGGRAATQLIEEIFLKHFANEPLLARSDQAQVSLSPGRLAISTDSHVVSPLFFPGGDIGKLAVNGTVNDVAMAGARPIYLTAGFIIEEGFSLSDLDRIAESMARAAREAGVSIVTGDTKVVEKGKGDGVFISTTGIGVIPDGIDVNPGRIVCGDAIILSGAIGEHGVAILSKRQNIDFETELESDCAALNGLVEAMVATGIDIHCLRDPTRGGLSAVLNELASAASAGILVEEEAIPLDPGVAAACELLGLDPLNIANEGKLVAFCPPEGAELLLQTMKSHPLGRNSSIIGHVVPDQNCFVRMRTCFGGERMIDWLNGEQLPRIC
jgi:hydrogenase expression/formation protein HypE